MMAPFAIILTIRMIILALQLMPVLFEIRQLSLVQMAHNDCRVLGLNRGLRAIIFSLR